MSQRGTFLTGGGGGGVVFTLQGNTGGKVGPDGTGNIHVVGAGNITVSGNQGTNTETITFTGVLPIVNGGTNASSFSTVDGTVYYDGTRLVTTATGTAGQVLTSNGAGVAPTYQAGGGGGITTINGDTGSVTGATVAFNGQPQAGGSVNFSGSGTTMLLNTTDANNNTFVGSGCGNTTATFTDNAGYGFGSLALVNNGQNNTAIGAASMGSLVSGNFNTGLGQTFQSLVAGDRNIALGYGSGLFLNGGSDNFIVGTYPVSGGENYTSTESSNICIANVGVTGESGVIRIGTNGTIGSCHIAGIDGVDLSTADLVTQVAGQLGSTVLTAGTNITITPGVNTLTIAATGGGGPSVYFIAFLNSSVTNVTGDGTLYTIPFNATSVNVGGAFNTGTGAFTAPTTGVYFFNINMYVQSLTPGVYTIGFAVIDINAGALDYTFINTNFSAMADANQNLSFNASQILSLTAGDVVTIAVDVIGGTKTVGLNGAASVSATNFSGYKIA